MAFERGIAQSVHVTTLATSDHLTETAPTTPVVTVSLDGGATFEATDNAAAATLYGIRLLLSAAETNRAFVRVRVTSANCDPRSLDFYFEENYTQAKAAFLDAAISGREASGAANAAFVAYDPPSRAEATSDANSIIAVLTAIKGPGWTSETLHAIYDALLASGTGAFPVTLYVKTAGSVPIQNAKVRINATGGDVVATTNSLGAIVLQLDAGTYTAYVGTAASYTPAASYAVVVSAAGAVTSPAGGVLVVTAIALPTPSDPDCYALYDTETDEQDATLPTATMTVTVTDLSKGGRVDATNNRFRSVMGRHTQGDQYGQWSLDIPIAAFTAGATLTLLKTWTDAAGAAQSETWVATLAAPASGVQVCLSDLIVRKS